MASELQGVRELSRQLAALGRLDEGRALRAAANAGIKPAVTAARFTAPVRMTGGLRKTYKGRLVAPGFLQRSVTSRVWLSRTRKKANAYLGVQQEAFYGLQFLELGTSRISKRPWLGPAFSATRNAQLAAVSESLRKSIDKLTKRK